MHMMFLLRVFDDNLHISSMALTLKSDLILDIEPGLICIRGRQGDVRLNVGFWELFHVKDVMKGYLYYH